MTQFSRTTDGRIYNPRGCEVNVALHCNLSCRACSHSSPSFRASFAQPELVHRDLARLRSAYACEFVKLLGGEPLLHPALQDVIRACREANIAPEVRLCTNGRLLGKVAFDMLALLDEVEVSEYPGYELQEAELRILEELAAHGTRARVCTIGRFRESVARGGTTDTALVTRIYRTCKVAHVWRCHTVMDGYFFKCAPASTIADQRSERWRQAGIRIGEGRRFTGDLAGYLESQTPLTTCYQCLGTVGKVFPHRQVPRMEFRHLQEASTESLIDWALLRDAEQKYSVDDYCKVGNRVREWPAPRR